MRAAANSVGSGRRELGIVLASYGLYSAVRALGRTNIELGLRNAERIAELERRLGIDVEEAWQRLFLRRRLGMPFWNALYMASQTVVMPLTLYLVYRHRPRAWPFLRNQAFLAWTAGLVWYAVQPTAPPRLMGGSIVDTVSAQTFIKLDSPFLRTFYNPVAAMPSLHVGMSPVVAWALVRLTPWTWTKLVGLAYPVVVTVTVVVTGNHFLLDVAGGLAVVLPSAAIAAALTDRPPASGRGILRRRRA